MTRLPPRILVLVPVTDVRCAAGHPIDVLPNLHRREWWQPCRYHYGSSSGRTWSKVGKCDAWLYLRPAGDKLVAVTDATAEQMRLLTARNASVLEIAEHIAQDAAVLRRGCQRGHTRGTA